LTTLFVDCLPSRGMVTAVGDAIGVPCQPAVPPHPAHGTIADFGDSMPVPCADDASRHAVQPLVRRVYEAPGDADGCRVLVDRLQPRGLTKQAAAVDLWLRDIAPSHGLRKALHTKGMAFDAFRAAYLTESRSEPVAMAALERLVPRPLKGR